MKNFLFGLFLGAALMLATGFSFNWVFNKSFAQAQTFIPEYYQQLAWGKHSQMDAALNLLIKARDHLDKAAHDYNGHRVKAIEYTDKAIQEVREGINFANNH
ncbi:hypothetical protein TDSAC_0986 [Thermodesulfobium acidiphilum]|uniref:Uncharacterized protein n=1 Tax=Thermodesulfobium acidiphilum TaxID=1794699 RepID=A0A2R4W0K7_THEAF|nr:hypothetical protein [Thermodesulfobium acidiphilum]AWB10339.1 hypothetical protein TDSAC_0986 [Thermodesulfobium acidiphilum]PMP85657.1 MAG: hypothetical protein C0174_03655 [Thermodesulfobium narugense]